MSPVVLLMSFRRSSKAPLSLCLGPTAGRAALGPYCWPGQGRARQRLGPTAGQAALGPSASLKDLCCYLQLFLACCIKVNMPEQGASAPYVGFEALPEQQL